MSQSPPPQIVPFRVTESAEAAILFVHGFGGNAKETWGNFPDLLKADNRLDKWDVLSLGYTSNLRVDLAGIWSADPPLQTTAKLLLTACAVDPIKKYKTLVLIAHSMGGLAVQRALLDDDAFLARISCLILFGTPSAGLVKAWLAQRLKRQLQDMARGGEFVTDVRNRWTAKFGDKPRFEFLAVAGETDEFVPYQSSLEPFPMAFRAAVPGNHIEIVKPQDAESLSVKVVLERITGGPSIGSRWNSARVAIQAGEFQRAIDELYPQRTELDDATAVQLALALEKCGRQPDAIELLMSRKGDNTDAKGTLAGRLKRRWLRGRRQADADQALALYQQAYGQSCAANNPHQAHYHAINVAFMQLTYKGDHESAQEWAGNALKYALQATKVESKADRCWNLATQGEAKLVLGDEAGALELYRSAAAATSEPWKWDSMYNQATEIARVLGDAELAKRLAEIFSKPLLP